MTVKEIFELRKQGRSEEAYDLIRPMYKEHHGHYTTLCMFWCATDVLKIRLDQVYQAESEALRDAKSNEAYAIFLSLQRLYPNLQDDDGLCAAQLYHNALRLKKVCPTFSVLLFLSSFGLERLSAEDWKPNQAAEAVIPSRASMLLSAAFHDFESEPTYENANRALPLFQEAKHREPAFPKYAIYESACLSLL